MLASIMALCTERALRTKNWLELKISPQQKNEPQYLKGWEFFFFFLNVRNENLGLFFLLTKQGMRWYFIFNIFILLGYWPCKGRVSSWVDSNFFFFFFIKLEPNDFFIFSKKNIFDYFLILDEKSLDLDTYWICN